MEREFLIERKQRHIEQMRREREIAEQELHYLKMRGIVRLDSTLKRKDDWKLQQTGNKKQQSLDCCSLP